MGRVVQRHRIPIIWSFLDLENSAFKLRDAIIKENPIKSGFLQKGGAGGLRGHPIQICNMLFKILDFRGRGHRLLKLAVQIYF